LLPPSTSISLAFALFPNINTTAPLSFRSTLLSFPFYHHLVVNSHPSIHPSIPSLLPQGAQGVFPEIVRELGRMMGVKHWNIGLGDCCHMEAGIDISPSREAFFTLSKYFLIC
jgi:hypothetical protein